MSRRPSLERLLRALYNTSCAHTPYKKQNKANLIAQGDFQLLFMQREAALT